MLYRKFVRVKNLSIKISGKVKKTGFLFYTKQFSKIYNIHGFAEYINNTTLFIEAEGKETELNKFIEYCKEGPFGSKITGFDIREGKIKHHHSFDISSALNTKTLS